MATEPIPLSGLARRLVDDGVIDAEVAIDATDAARKNALPLVSYLVQKRIGRGTSDRHQCRRRVRRTAHGSIDLRFRIHSTRPR